MILFLFNKIYLKTKNKKNVLENTWFQRGFEFFKNKEKSEASKIKSSRKNATSMIYKFFILELYFETFWYYFILEFALYSYYGDKKKWTSFKSFVSKITRTSVFDLTTHDSYFTILVDVFMDHILAENMYFTNHIE